MRCKHYIQLLTNAKGHPIEGVLELLAASKRCLGLLQRFRLAGTERVDPTCRGHSSVHRLATSEIRLRLPGVQFERAHVADSAVSGPRGRSPRPSRVHSRREGRGEFRRRSSFGFCPDFADASKKADHSVGGVSCRAEGSFQTSTSALLLRSEPAPSLTVV